MKTLLLLACCVALAAGFTATVQAQDAQAESIVGRWTFEPGEETIDVTGNFDDLMLKGAEVADGKLDVSPAKWAVTSGYSGPDIAEKTLVSWVIMESLNVQMGSIITIDKISVDEFDGIIFGERQPQTWMNGSSFFRRTNDFDPGFTETETGELIQIAITYQDDGGTLLLKNYRNGEFGGEYSQGTIVTWVADDAEVFFGKRHGNVAAGGPGDLDCLIEEARIYGVALTQEEIQSLAVGAVNPVGAHGKLTTQWAAMKVY